MSNSQEQSKGPVEECEGVEGKSQARVRKTKKPEIQLYRPGALRSRRSTGSGDQPTQRAHTPEGQIPRPEAKGEVREEAQRSDVARKTQTKGRHRPAREVVVAKEDTAGEKKSSKQSEKIPSNRESVVAVDNTHLSSKNEENFVNRAPKEYSQLESTSYHVKNTKCSDVVSEKIESAREKEKLVKEKNAPISPDNRHSEVKTKVIINHAHYENDERSPNAKQKTENYTYKISGKNAVVKNDKHVPERRPPKREVKKYGKQGEAQCGSDVIKAGTDKSHTEKSDDSLAKKNFSVQQERYRNNNKSSKELSDSAMDTSFIKKNKRNAPEKAAGKVERSPNESSTSMDSVSWSDQTKGRPSEAVRESEGKPGVPKHCYNNKSHAEATKTEVKYKETLDKQHPKSSRGNKWPHKVQGKVDLEYFPESENLKLREEELRSVQELAAKVDQLACSKTSGKAANSKKKAKGRNESQNEGKDYIQGDSKRDTWLEDQTSNTHSQSPDKFGMVHMGENKAVPSVVGTKESTEKASRVMSYSNARERRKRGNSKTQSPGSISGSPKEELKIEVTINKDNHERVPSLPQKIHKKESDPGELVRGQQVGRGSAFSKKMEDASSHTPKTSASFKSKSGRHTKESVGTLEKLNSNNYDSEDEGMDSMVFLDVPEDDWGQEVDRDTTWCNQSEGKGRLQAWEDEKLSWRTKKVKPQSEGEDPPRRVESPGRRGGLIQLPMAASGPETPGPEPGAPHQATPPPPLMQKHLYNPNNPSKPVAVVPSARDMPATREAQRGSGWGSPGEGAAGASFLQGSQVGEYPLESSSTKVDPSVLYSISKGEMDISYYVSSNQLPVEFRRIMDIRGHLQGCYKQLLLSDIRLCQEKNIEGSLWKTLYYIIIEKLREYISRDPSLKERSLSTLLMLVEEGLRYLQDLLEALQREYGFTLEDYLEEEGEVRGRVRVALLSAQKLLLSLGDLARYKEHYNASPNYNIAKKWYQMALQVYPRNGRPFNQLAIIAFSQKRPLDVVYYYIRSLTASNPIMSARDSLVAMFDDIRKRYISAQRSEPHPEGSRASVGRSLSHEGLRQELWIRPDSGATNRRTLSHSNDSDDSDKDDDLKKMSKEQLMKMFLASYLHCHGMLFSGVGLDGFRECCVNMLREFSVLLEGSPPRLSTSHLLQIMAINMYAITNTEVKDVRVGGSGYRSAAQDLALVLSQEMMGRLVRVVVELLPHHLHPAPPDPAPDTQRLFSPTLAHFMPPLKAWCDWLLYHSAVWNPPPTAHEYRTSGCPGTWASVAELATILRGFGTPDVALTQSTAGSGGATGDQVVLRLTEDTFLRGYEPLLPAHATLTLAPAAAHPGRARDWARVARLQTSLCQFLCGVDPPVLRLQKTDHGDELVSVVDTSPPPSPTSAAARVSFSASDVEVEESLSESEASEGEEEQQEGEAVDEDGLTTTVKNLTRRKRMLEKKHRQQKRLQSLLEGSVTLEMEVRPRYLVPDTNCFIEHLDVIQDLAGGPYTIMVPLVVLNELDGLSRDAAVAKYGSVGHAVRVREGAAAALHYLRTSRPHSLKCVTSQGSVLSSTLFTSEMDLPDATNDDKILSCCVHFCSDSTQRRPIRVGVRRLYREVVLLTEDRNLRVKAHGRDVPVRDLLDFARWAGVR